MATTTDRPRRQDREHQEQCAVIEWARLMPARFAGAEPGESIADYLHAIPNGGGRSKAQAGRLKAEGVLPGVSDLFFPVPVAGYHGMYIEMKAPNGRLTGEQLKWQHRMERQGYRAIVCYSAGDAIFRIERYLALA